LQIGKAFKATQTERKKKTDIQKESKREKKMKAAEVVG